MARGRGGANNSDLAGAIKRVKKSNVYHDASTICIIPTKSGMISTKVAAAIWSLVSPMNQKFQKYTIEGKEVGEAYNEAVNFILANPELSKWQYMLTLEHDNLPPADGLLKLMESIRDYDAVGGLYWTKGEYGMPMIYGDPSVKPRNYIPQLPVKDSIQECNGLGMGFTLFRISMLKKMTEILKGPLFKTLQDIKEGGGCMTQDLYFFANAAKEGYKFACDTRVLVGHLDLDSNKVW